MIYTDLYYSKGVALGILTIMQFDIEHLAHGAMWQHPFVADYLRQAVLEVNPYDFPAGMPSLVHVAVIKESDPYASALHGGTILLTTGLLSQIRPRSELLAVLQELLQHDPHYLRLTELANRYPIQRIHFSLR